MTDKEILANEVAETCGETWFPRGEGFTVYTEGHKQAMREAFLRGYEAARAVKALQEERKVTPEQMDTPMTDFSREAVKEVPTDNWVKCSERLPEEGERVILNCDKKIHGNNLRGEGFYKNNTFYWVDTDSQNDFLEVDFKVTAWMSFDDIPPKANLTEPPIVEGGK